MNAAIKAIIVSRIIPITSMIFFASFISAQPFYVILSEFNREVQIEVFDQQPHIMEVYSSRLYLYSFSLDICSLPAYNQMYRSYRCIGEMIVSAMIAAVNGRHENETEQE